MILLRLPPNIVPIQSYALVSFTFIAAQFFSFHSLLFVSYPTQVLTKSCKPIPGLISILLLLYYNFSPHCSFNLLLFIIINYHSFHLILLPIFKFLINYNDKK